MLIVIGSFYQEENSTFGMLAQNEKNGKLLTIYNSLNTQFSVTAKQAVSLMAKNNFTAMTFPLITEDIKIVLDDLKIKSPRKLTKIKKKF